MQKFDRGQNVSVCQLQIECARKIN